MTKTKPSRNPLNQIPGAVGEELLTHISIDQPLTNQGVKHRKPSEQIAQDSFHLIVRIPLPFHTPQRIGTQ